jgi:hypothetical protein
MCKRVFAHGNTVYDTLFLSLLYTLDMTQYIEVMDATPPCDALILPRVYKEGEGECRTAYILRVTTVRTIHDLCNDIHVCRSPWNVLALMQRDTLALLWRTCACTFGWPGL